MFVLISGRIKTIILKVTLSTTSVSFESLGKLPHGYDEGNGFPLEPLEQFV
jgi:hypothetical protein